MDDDIAGRTAPNGDSVVAWRPDAATLRRSRLLRFLAASGVADLPALCRRAADDPAWFWDAVVRDLDLEFLTPYERILDLVDGMAWPHWFIGGRYNYVHNALDRHARGDHAGKVAVSWEGEEGSTRQLTFADLASAVDRLAWALRRLGIVPGDRIGLFMPMVPEVVVAMLACGKTGAVAVPIFSGFAAPAVAERLRDCSATLLIAADTFPRRGRPIPMAAIAAAAASAASVAHVLLFPRAEPDRPTKDSGLFPEYDAASHDGPFPTVQTEADAPALLLYTSGTTGRPKGVVHSHAGFPIKAAQDLAHCFDLQHDDTLLWLTDIGWMMGPWAVCGALALGASIALYDGAPDYPTPHRLWQLVGRHHVTVLGVSPTAIRALMARDAAPTAEQSLATLRAFGSTGEPWNPRPWWWLFDRVGARQRPIINYSGGTEISGGILSGFTITPSVPCAFAGPVPGIDADVVDEHGTTVRGAVGELVIRRPWVGMANGFWRDPDRYLATYWSRLPGLWLHGDWARVDGNWWYILGRSDDTIKLAGKRVGPAEVESAAVAHPAVAEAAAVGLPHPVKGESLALFVLLRNGSEPTEELREELREQVAGRLGRALRPDDVRFVTDLPRTRNAKLLRRLVRAARLGRSEMGDVSSLDNPSSLDAIRNAT